ncbi:dynein axonemal intermediate chain 4 [Drosophila ficusphila]|uniref:dynein axonemal intermediate chain 4 n=1 Tax=Drosophila ficusphila TaxID=30025 RepID=UPI0007E6B508|nr:dynein axonemal intermediate chain 4 [Drosophila ficusphila]XP_043063771.1 dynein axonemal intermediate chain 4 [Drosophila ficusphila]
MSMSLREGSMSQDNGSMYKSSAIEVDPKKKSVQVPQAPGEEGKPKKKDGMHHYMAETQADLQYRSQIKVAEKVDDEEVDMTPKPILNEAYVELFMKYNLNVLHQVTNFTTMMSQSQPRSRTRSSMRAGIGGNKLSIDDLMNGIIYETINWEPYSTVEARELAYVPRPYTRSFVKITLRKSELFELHSQPQTTVAKGSPEGEEAERDNRLYEYLTVGKGKVRRRSDNDAQTDTVLVTSRAANTILISKATVSSYVSNFEMYDTLNNISKEYATSMMGSVKDLPAALAAQAEEGEVLEDEVEAVAEKDKVTSQTERLLRSAEFRNAVMYMGRTLSSNNNEAGMRRFRNFDQVERWNAEAEYVYSLNLLFRLVPEPSKNERKAVSDIDFCRSNGDILAVAYGLYSFSSQRVPTSGSVFLWSVKNPGEPERAYYYDVPVTAISFSPFLPSLLAIGLYDGGVEVRDVSSLQDMPVAVSQRSTSPGSAPVVAIRWIKQVADDEEEDIDPFLSLSQDGSVTRFRIIKSPFLLGFTQMTLERVEGHPEGIFVPPSSRIPCESNRHPQGLSLTTHPLHKDIYYVLTDEGCIHKCSINYQHQYLEVLRCHDGGVTVMEFSPWSPKLFLTCGNDWFVRVWIDGITRPLLELQDEMTPVHWAKWSPTHSTIIVSVNRETANVWDFRRNLLRPMSKHKMDSSFNTVARFSHCGRTLVIGNERGNTLFNALNDMPFSPHFQYDELEKAIFKAVGNDHELLMELKSIGFFGYPDKRAFF